MWTLAILSVFRQHGVSEMDFAASPNRGSIGPVGRCNMTEHLQIVQEISYEPPQDHLWQSVDFDLRGRGFFKRRHGAVFQSWRSCAPRTRRGRALDAIEMLDIQAGHGRHSDLLLCQVRSREHEEPESDHRWKELELVRVVRPVLAKRRHGNDRIRAGVGKMQ
jgi:hypothetical protein